MDLILDQTGVHYSTPLENFEASILNLLDKGILCTHNLSQLDKVTNTSLINCISDYIMCILITLSLVSSGCLFLSQFVMKNLFIPGEPVLESVGLWEPAVKELREKLGNALRQATIPLQAYAREYECHLELHNSDIKTFLEYNSF